MAGELWTARVNLNLLRDTLHGLFQSVLHIFVVGHGTIRAHKQEHRQDAKECPASERQRYSTNAGAVHRGEAKDRERESRTVEAVRHIRDRDSECRHQSRGCGFPWFGIVPVTIDDAGPPSRQSECQERPKKRSDYPSQVLLIVFENISSQGVICEIVQQPEWITVKYRGESDEPDNHEYRYVSWRRRL